MQDSAAISVGLKRDIKDLTGETKGLNPSRVNQTEDEKENKMGTHNISTLMLTMGIPMILSMVLQACYNIVDSMFVGRMADGERALTALTVAFPVQMLIVAFSIGTGVGVNALLSRSLGQHDVDKTAKAAGNGIFLGMIIYVAFIVFGIFGTDAYLKTQTKNPTVLRYAGTYLRICCIISFGMVMFSIFEKLLQSTGKTVLSTTAQIAGAVTNIVLDPIMIFGYFGCPKLGIAGAAYATVIGQIVSFVLAAIFHFTLNKEVKSGLKYLKPDGKIIKAVYAIGIPAIIMQALMSFMTYGVNIIFYKVSESAVTAYGIFYKIQQFIFFAAFGLRDAITPIVSYNYGRGSKERVKDGIKYGVIYTLIIMTAGIIGLQIFAAPLAKMFGLEGETVSLCVRAMRIISAGFIFAGINIALQGVFQAIECGAGSLVVSLLRLLVVVLPLAWLFARLSDAALMIWFAFPIAELAAALVAIVFMIKASKKLLAF